MCPSAEQLLGKLASDRRVVPIAFHVDYFDKPWKDPFSDPRFSRREMQYSLLYDRANNLNKPDYLYLTPLVLVDGRVPMVGKDDAATKSRAQEAILRALAERPSVSVEASWPGDRAEASRSLEVAVSALSGEARGAEVLVAAVPFSASTTTKVGSGELAGKTYDGRFVARGFEVESVTVPESGRATAKFALKPPKGADLERDGVVVIVQDEATGRILQAAKIGWRADGPKAKEKEKEKEKGKGR